MKIFIKLFAVSALLLATSQCGFADCDTGKIKASFVGYDEVMFSTPLTIEEIEKRETAIYENVTKQNTKPFGSMNADWEKMKAMHKNGDCIIHFRTDEKSWKTLSGREGYLLARNGKVLYVILTKVN